MKIQGHQSAQLVSVERNVFKELDDSLSEFFFFSIEAGVDDFLSQEFPQPFNQIQIGGVGRQENGDDLGGGYPLGQCFVLVVAGVVRDDIHVLFVLVGQQDLLIELPSRGRIHTGALDGEHLSRLPGIDHRVDVDPVAATDGGLLPLGAFLNPGMGRARTPRMQPFGWNAEGTPAFGVPVATTEKLKVPEE